jgi:DNA/RNA endonuclease YhcR with UshA esterase domain
MNSRICAVCIAFLLTACLKKKNELPEVYGSDDWATLVNYNLKKLNELNPIEGAPILIDSNWIIAARVIADDESGNWSNQIIIEDSSAGISLKLNENSLHTRFPIGRKVYVKLKGLYLGNENGTAQIGSTPAPDNSGVMQVSEIASKSIGQFVSAGKSELNTKSTIVKIEDLMTARKDLINRLITIENVEIANPYFDNLYAEATSASSIKMRDCSGNNIQLRTSNYARFQAFETPKGKGQINAVYTVYKGIGQLMIRDTNDLQLYQNRCDGSNFQEPVLLSLDSLRKIYPNNDTTLGNYIIRGIVTSDAANKNFGKSTIVLQDAFKGMLIYFSSSAAAMPELGDSVEIKIAGSILTKYEGALELKNLKSSKMKILAKGKSISPIQLTIAALNTHFEQYESVLVKIINAKMTSTGNFGGAKTLSDATGNIILYTSYSATFANTAIPTITKTFQGIVTPYNSTKEIKIRNPALDIY